ncbi:unnamed protein product [Dovyalis caffra]|uniref:UDP-glycosyltransferase n=1 Tax=Dovyalis caffra TaxID=77055 RepID=A0AAV1QS69_9ROSI|nr:unnamed protein product [Dovyalis caffra]
MESLRESHMQQRLGRSLLLFPFPLQGHLNPMLQLANILYSKGFSIIIIHLPFNSPNPLNYPHFTFYSIPDGLLEHEPSIYLVTVLNTKCVKPFSDGLSQLLLDFKEEPISCIITDALWYFTQALADTFKLPRIVLQTFDISTFHVLASLPLLREKGYFGTKDFQLEEPVTETPPLKVKDLPEIKSEDFHRYIARVINGSKASSALIWNSFEELQKDSLTRLCQDFPIPSFTIGADQKVVARYASDVWKIGIHLDDMVERGKIERIIKRLMVEAEREGIRERIMSLKEKLNLNEKQQLLYGDLVYNTGLHLRQ